jgi:hypothetical protein
MGVDRNLMRRTSLAVRTVRAFVTVHRFLGTAFCLVFFAWFASGIVMMYTGYPLLSEAEKLARMAALDTTNARLSPAEAWQRTKRSDAPADVRLGMLERRPVYRFATTDWTWVTVAADDGTVLGDLDVESAGRLADEFAPGAPQLQHLGHFDSPDQWTFFSLWAPHLAGQAFSPVHKFARNDADGTELYVLAATGDIVQTTTRRERFWGYLGPVVHWAYPTSLRADPDAWNDVVVWLSVVGMTVSISGLVLGLYRWRRGARVALSPYQGWMKWHHYLGLVFGLFASTWVFSGLLSMDPWNMSRTDDTPDGSHQDAMRGGALDLTAIATAPAAALAACNQQILTKELRLSQLRGEPYYWCVESPARSRLVSARVGGETTATLSRDVLSSAGRALMPSQRLAASDWLTDYDAYYYPGWYDKVVRGGVKRLPVLRLTFDDPGRTLVYVDPYSAAPILAYDTSGRWYRWLFHGLHSLDFGWLYRSRPLWDIVVLPLMLGGVLLSATGVWIGLRWIRRSLRVTRRRAASPEALVHGAQQGQRPA